MSARHVNELAWNSVERLRGIRDHWRIARAYPDLERKIDLARADLKHAYDDYASTVSTPDWAISLELASVLRTLCEIARPRRVVDLGSGFSSYVLVQYAQAFDASVVSVDTNPAWLSRTREFLERAGLPVGGLVEWKNFVAHENLTFDLVLDDLGSVDDRIDTVPAALSLVERGGVAIFDDRHRANLRSAVARECRSRGLEYLSLREVTRDQFGRYAGLVICAPSRT